MYTDSKEQAMNDAETKKSGVETLEHVSSAELAITRSLWKENKKIIAIALFINIASLEYGIDSGTVNGFQAMPGFLAVFGYADPRMPGGSSISTKVQQLITSLATLGMFISGSCYGVLSTYLGRKGVLWVASVFLIISITVQIIATTHTSLYLGRLILGLGNGLYVVGGQTYMQECIPANLRSLNFTFYQIWIGLGALLGAIINNYTAVRLDRTSYQIPLGINYIGVIILAVGLLFLPESPRLLSVQRKHDEAFKSLRRLRDAAYTDLQIQEDLAEIRHAIDEDLTTTSSVRFYDIFRKNAIRRTLTSFAVANFNTANGGQFILQYGVYFFLLSGDTKPFRDVVILLCLGLFGTMLTPFFAGWIGKRQILMFGSLILALCMLGMGLAYTTHGVDPLSGRTIVSMTIIFLFFYGSTVSPFSAQVAGEIPSQPLRAYTLAFSWSCSFLLGWVLTFTAPYFINPNSLNWGAKYAYIWVPSNVLCAIFTFFFVPETNKRTLEEIDECYLQNVPIRKFKEYQCVGVMEARREAVTQQRRASATSL